MSFIESGRNTEPVTFRESSKNVLGDLKRNLTEPGTLQTFDKLKLSEIINEEKRKKAEKAREETSENLKKVYEVKQQNINKMRANYLKKKEEENLTEFNIKTAREKTFWSVYSIKEKTINDEYQKLEDKNYLLQKLSQQEDTMLERLDKMYQEEFKAQKKYKEIGTLPLGEAVEKFKSYLPRKRPGKLSKSSAGFKEFR